MLSQRMLDQQLLGQHQKAKPRTTNKFRCTGTPKVPQKMYCRRLSRPENDGCCGFSGLYCRGLGIVVPDTERSLSFGATPLKMPATAAGETSGTTMPRPRQYSPENPQQPSFHKRLLGNPGIMNIGTIDVYLNKTGSSLQTMVYSEEEQENDAWNMYTERKNIVLEFLCSDLSLHLLKRHHKRIELLKKCSYYIEILPKHLALGDQNHLMLPTTMFQLIDPWRFQRMKKVGSIQTKIQLLLLSELLEQLERGREELVQFLETYDVMTFLSRWDVIRQRLSSLSEQMDHFLALLVPGRLHIKHRLVSDVGVTKIPHIRLVIITKMPVMFDRKESAAHLDWVSLRWFVSSQQPQVEQYELRFKLLEPRAPQDKIHCGIMAVTSNTCEIHNLQPDRLYRFTIKRAEIYTLVYEQWRDSILLKTKPYPEEDMESAMSEPHLSHLSNTQGM